MAFCFILYAAFPGVEARKTFKTVTFNLKNEDAIPLKDVQERPKKVGDEVQNALKSGRYPAELYVAHYKEIRHLMNYQDYFTEKVQNQGSPYHIITSLPLNGVVSAFETINRNNAEEMKKRRLLMSTDPEILSLSKFSPMTEDWHPLNVVSHFAKSYYLTILPALFMLLFLTMWDNPTKPTRAFARLIAFPERVIFWPIGMWAFLDFDRMAYLKRTMTWFSYVTSAVFAIVGGSGTAFAQSVKANSESKKKSQGYSLQADLRNTAFVNEGPPNPSLFNRLSFYTPKRFVLESISTAIPRLGRWYNETGAGFFIHRTPKTWVIGDAYVSYDSTSNRQLIAGGQFFKFSPRYVVAVPVMRVEKSLTKPTTTLAFATNPLFRLSNQGRLNRLAVSPDFGIKKTFGLQKTTNPLVTWNAGLGLDWFPGKANKNRVEAAVLRNHLGQWQFRARSVLNFAF